MTDGERHISSPPEADGAYKHLLIGNVRPVRVTHDECRKQISAESPDIRDGGALKIQNILLTLVLNNPEVDDLTKAEFVRMCRATASAWSKP